MVNKKKSLKKSALNDGHGNETPPASNDRAVPVIQEQSTNIQSSDLFQVKEETDIKQEPVFVGELVDISAPTCINTAHVFDSNEPNGEYDFDFPRLDKVKDEVKKECVDKKREEPMTNADSGEDAMNNQPDQSTHDELDFVVPENNDNANSTQRQGVSAHRNPAKPHKCNFCEYSAKRKDNLNRHLLKHTGEKPHECNFCPKRFTRKEGLRAHMKAHVKEFLFHCPGCLLGFDLEDEKLRHETKCNIRGYECHLCQESFGSMKGKMMEHMRVHSGNRPFECKECFKKFTQKGDLDKHMKCHAGPRPFRCSKCREGFPQQDERNAHEEKCNRRVYECDVCCKSFGMNKTNLISHMRIHSDETPFECKRCLKQFKHKNSLDRHMASHTKKLPFKCLICRHGFLNNNKRKAHQRNCNRRYYECHLCKKFFRSDVSNLKNHMRIHSGERPYQCALCEIAFTWKTNLKCHTKRAHNKKY